MATIQILKNAKGEKTYKAVIRIKGYKTMCANFKRKTDAIRWINEIEPKMKAGRHLNDYEAKKHTLEELINRYVEIELPKRKEHDHKKYKMYLEWWNKQIGKYLLSKVTPSLLSECKERLVTEKAEKPQKGRTTRTGATANRYMAALSSVFSIAIQEWGWLEENPMRKVRKFKEIAQRDRFLSSEEIAKLLQACKTFELDGENYNYQTYLFVLIALSTGARYSEIHTLKWGNIDLTHKQFYFMQTKNVSRHFYSTTT